MGDIRGDKVSFRKKDIVSLNDLPSSQVAEPLIVHCPPSRSFSRRCLRFFTGLLAFLVLLVGGIALALETGSLDGTLSSGAQSALNAAIAPRYRVEIGSSVIRFSSKMHLAVEARDVALKDVATGDEVSRTAAVRLVLDPMALFDGRVSVREIEAEGVALDPSLMSGGEPIDLSKLRIDGIPAALDAGFAWLDQSVDFMRRSGTDSLRLDGISSAVLAKDGSSQPVVLDDVTLSRDGDGPLVLTGSVLFEGRTTEFRVDAEHRDQRTEALSAVVNSVDLEPFLLRRDKSGNIRQGLVGAVDLNIRARRGFEGTEPGVSASISGREGKIYFDGVAQEIDRLEVALAYDFRKNTLELLPSGVEFGPMRIPFTGGLIDLDRLERGGKAGIGIDFLVNDGWADAPDAGEEPFPFSLKVFGRYLHGDRLLDITELTAQTASGRLDGKLKVSLATPSPEIRFNAQIPQMQTGMVKQLWPYWMAARPRHWVFANLFGGTVRNATIDVFIPQGRLSVEPVPLELRGDELRLAFDIENARVNIAGDIPPIRDTSGRLELHGETLTVKVDSGTSYFGADRSVKVEGAEIGIASTYHKPLMADIKVSVSGEAAAVGEFVSYEPINALGRAGFSAEDLSGTVRADADLRLGLVRAQNPPPPEWKVGIDLTDVALAREFDGRKVSKLNGRLEVDPLAARLDGKGEIDGIPMDVKLTEPIDKTSTVKRERVVKLRLNEKQTAQFMPGLDDIVGGSLDLEVTRLDEKRQAVVADLGAATLTVPWLGWTKGAGVPAKAEFVMAQQDDGVTLVDKFVLSGDGFGTSGEMRINRNGLISSRFERVRLSPQDDFSLSVNQQKGAYQIKVDGKSADLRSILGRLKSGSAASGGAGAAGNGFSGRIDARLDRGLGFNDETMTNLTLRYVARAGKTTAVDLSAVTENSQAVVGQLVSEGATSTVSLTSSDAGAVARFSDLYNRIQGGLVNLKLEGITDGPWIGSLDVRNFRLENEQRLQSMVSAPTGADGRSLNNAVKRDIDVSSEKFQRGFARLVYQNQALRIDNGVVRGEQIGATFQGYLRDAKGNMDMTGTFMPAYGLNRLFAELPVIGILLGNGRDRGLIGITFKLTGPLDKPRLNINPLSLIAPGVFRQIFEFQ